MVTSLEASLKKLQTTYVDILCESTPAQDLRSANQADIHWWDWTTPVAEVMQGLNNLVKAGKGEQ